MIRDEHLQQIAAGARPYSNESRAMATELIEWRSGSRTGAVLTFDEWKFELRISFNNMKVIQITKPNGESFLVSG